MEDHMQHQRFEKKYRISEAMAVQVREFLSSYLEPDEHSIGRPDYSYPVHSLYLDSDQLATYWMTTNGERNRFKLRIRFYNARPETPVFFEIKRRSDHCILKQRGGVRKEAVPGLLSGQLPASEHLLSENPKDLFALQRFIELMQELEARPKMHVAYRREAWVDARSNALRVTMDRQVLGEPEPATHFSTALRHPCRPFGNTVILELKFTDRFPDWLRAMVEKFNLVRCSAAKYCEIVDEIGQEPLEARLRAAANHLKQGHPSMPALDSGLILPDAVNEAGYPPAGEVCALASLVA